MIGDQEIKRKLRVFPILVHVYNSFEIRAKKCNVDYIE